MNVMLVCGDAAGIQTLRRLKQGSHNVAAVLASADRAYQHGSAWSVARSLGYSPWPVELVNDPSLADRMRALQIDVLLNVYSLRLIRADLLAVPRRGSFNLHPGPLPRYAGLNSVCWAIYNGETRHGVTLHRMVKEVDAGSIIYQASVEIAEDDTGLTLTSKCVREGVPLVFRLLDALERAPESLPELPQDLSQRTFFDAAPPQSGRLTWSDRARRIVDFVRSADFTPFRSPWGHPTTSTGAGTIGIAKASLTRRACGEPPGTVGAACGPDMEVASSDEWVLVRLVSIDRTYRLPADILRTGEVLSEGTQN
jgi:UDP-4-amino-4-deoxy-L-arabinose formyltransferase/UDP-glucuronic acid dehydrogenase (UDP-4-keto-hexauronic acid decarboxylating)